MGIDDGGTSRFPFLATVRYLLATVVTVLTLVVVVMVITVALRPQDINVSIVQGYIQSDSLWHAYPRTANITVHLGSRGPAKAGVAAITSEVDLKDTYYEYGPVSNVSLKVSLRAQNPSGRADIKCQNITVRILDMPGGATYYNLTGMVELQKFNLSDDFTVERQSSHTVRAMLTLDNTTALSYIAKNYGGQSSFQAMVQVNATIVSSKAARSNTTSQYCWPVTIGLPAPGVTDDVACKPSQEMVYTIPTDLLGASKAPVNLSHRY